MVSQTEEALGYAAEGKKFADDFGPVSNITLKDVGKFVAEMTPIVGDAMAAKQVYDELQKDEPNYYLAGALGGAALVGLFPGIGDVAAKAIRKGAREVFDVAKRVEVDPNAMGSGLGNVKLKPKQKNKLEDFGYYEDNPTTKGFSDDWMSTKQRYAEEDAAKGGLGSTKKFFSGPITATIGGSSSKGMFLDTKFVSSLKGANDEVRNLNDIKFQELKKDILKEGFDPDQKGNKIVIGVNHKGDAFIIEGNTRAAIAKEQNIPSVKTEVRYWNGAETVDGKYTPEKIIEKAVTKQELNMAQGGAIPMNNQMELFGEGGLKDEGGEIDEVSGNEVPIGGTKEGVRDDIPANVSEGEFIFPEDVVRFIGLDKLMKIRQNAKMGLKKMEAMGQMGNSDEATIDDDMPFEMADLIVVGGKGEPMKFADGGFVPVQNFQEGGTPGIRLPDEQRELITAPVPTFNPDEIADYDAYMSSVSVEVKVYVNADGEKINVTFINGVPTLPIEPGYTLYVPPEEGAETTTEEEIAATINNKNRDRDTEPYRESTAPKQINYAALSPEDFAARMEYESSKGYRLQKAVALGISSLVPFGAGLAYGTMRGHARQSEIRLNEMIANATTEELKAKYTTIRDNFLKANGLQPSSESGVIAKWVDGFLVGSGINPEAATDAASAVDAFTQVGSYSIESDKLAQVLSDPASELYTGSTNVTARPASYDPAQFGSGDPTLNTSAIATSPEIVPSASDTDLGKFSGSPSSSTDFKNLSTKDQMAALREKGAAQSYGLKTYKDPSDYDYVVDEGYTGNLKNLNPDEMQAIQNLQMVRDARSSLSQQISGDRLSQVAGGTKVAGSPAPVPAQTGDPSVSTGTSNVGQRPATYDPSQFGSGEPVAATSSSTEQVPIMSEKNLSNFISRTGKGILNFITSGTGNTAKETPSVTSTEPYTPQQFTNQFAVPNQQLPESVSQQTQSSFIGPKVPASVADSSRMLKNNQLLGGGQQETFSPVVTTDPRGTSAGDLGYSSLNQIVDPRTNVLTTPAVYPEGMDPSKIKYTPPKVSETPIVTTPKVPNTTYQTLANELTKGDGKKYVNGKLLDDAGNQVNTLYQQTANLFTPFDGKVYENGVLVDSETKEPITQAAQAATVAEPKRTEVWKDKLSGAALRAAQDAEKANYTGSTVNDFAIGVISDGKTKGVLANAEGKVIRDANNRTVYVDAEGKQYVKTGVLGTGRETPTGTVNSNKEDSGESKQQSSAPTVSVKPKVRKEDSGESKQKTSKPKIKEESIKSKISRGGGFNKGGLASKPIKTKKTKKRGLAAR